MKEAVRDEQRAHPPQLQKRLVQFCDDVKQTPLFLQEGNSQVCALNIQVQV
jgi:hypothetical protein